MLRDNRSHKIGVYLDPDVKNRLKNAIVVLGMKVSHGVEEAVRMWLDVHGGREVHYTDKDGNHCIKAAGEPFPQRPARNLKAGRPPE